MGVSIQANSVISFANLGGGLDSTRDRVQRQQKCASQVNFFEKQKENLKNMECSTLEDIARKLEMFHSYEDQIAAAKKQYNNSQLAHVLDEAKEIGEKIAEEAEKTAPKTEEERREDRIEEAVGTEEESKGMLSEIMDEMADAMEELEEELEEQLEEELDEGIKESLDEGLMENQNHGLSEETSETAVQPQEDMLAGQDAVKKPEQSLSEAVSDRIIQEQMEQKAQKEEQEETRRKQIYDTQAWMNYRHMDFRI